MKITVSENFRAVFYAPFYALTALGFTAREGLEIEWVPSGVPGGAIDDVKAGRLDAMFGGPMRVLKDHDTTPADDKSLVCFGEVVGRDPFYLVGQETTARFSLKDLQAMRTGIVSEVPTPWYCLRQDLEEAGVDVAALRRRGRLVEGLTMPQQLEALAAGKLDIVQVFEPYPSLALGGDCRILYVAALRGPCVYTTFITSRASAARCREEFAALTRALQALLDSLAANGVAELARATASYDPDVPVKVLRSGLERYQGFGLWSRTTRISEAGFERLALSLHSGGFIKRRASYQECVHDFGRTA